MVAALLRAYANIANELAEAGYTAAGIAAIREEVTRFERLRDAVKIKSGDYIDLKRFEPAMRRLIDTYVRAEDSKKVSALDDLSLVDLILHRGIDGAVEELPPCLRKKQEAVAETIENNVRKLIIDETPVNPKYYERMSELLDALILQRKQQALDYRDYLRQIEKLVKDAKNPSGAGGYPNAVGTSAQRALFDNLGRDEALALAVDAAVRANRQDGFRENPVKRRKVRLAIEGVLKEFGRLGNPAPEPVTGGIHEDEAEASPTGRVEVEPLVELVCRQHEY
jgi:type I restriction enzyme R subunit